MTSVEDLVDSAYQLQQLRQQIASVTTSAGYASYDATQQQLIQACWQSYNQNLLAKQFKDFQAKLQALTMSEVINLTKQTEHVDVLHLTIQNWLTNPAASLHQPIINNAADRDALAKVMVFFDHLSYDDPVLYNCIHKKALSPSFVWSSDDISSSNVYRQALTQAALTIPNKHLVKSLLPYMHDQLAGYIDTVKLTINALKCHQQQALTQHRLGELETVISWLNAHYLHTAIDRFDQYAAQGILQQQAHQVDTNTVDSQGKNVLDKIIESMIAAKCDQLCADRHNDPSYLYQNGFGTQKIVILNHITQILQQHSPHLKANLTKNETWARHAINGDFAKPNMQTIFQTRFNKLYDETHAQVSRIFDHVVTSQPSSASLIAQQPLHDDNDHTKGLTTNGFGP